MSTETNGREYRDCVWTPTQRRMLDVLADGLAHGREELHACLGDELTSPGTVRVHLSQMRLKLRPMGQDIVCELGWGRRLGYRHVRMLGSVHD